MSAQKKNLNKEIIALFSGQSSTITTPKIYLELTKKFNLAVVLNQCVFWSNKSNADFGYFYKSYEDWFEEIHVPERTLRRLLEKLEIQGWITTKVKKINGVNTKHILTHMDRIIDSISIYLDKDPPGIPEWPNGSTIEQKNCTEIAPTGHIGRSRTATLSVSSLYTEENIQINTDCSSSFNFSEVLDKKILDAKLPRDKRSEKEFMLNVIDHIDNHSDKKFSRIIRAQAALKLLKNLQRDNILFYAKVSEEKSKSSPYPLSPFTKDELDLVNEYKHALKMAKWGSSIEIHMPDEERRDYAKVLLARIESMEDVKCLPEMNVRKNSLTSVSNLVSHLNLSQQNCLAQKTSRT